MNCKKCHKEIPDESIYCNWCGKKQVTEKRARTHRRAKGTGTITIDNRNKVNPYIARAPGTTGGQGYQYIGAFPNRMAAQVAIDKYFTETRSDMASYNVAQLYDKWSEMHFKTLSQNGIQGYKTAYKYLSYIHARKVKDLKTTDYQYCIDECAKKFSRAQCEKIKQLCSQLCKYAMQNDIINKNYAEFIKLPKQRAKKEKAVFSNNQIAIMWKHSDDDCVQIILFMIYTGFRIGEVFTIERENVNLEEHYVVGGIKSEAGRNRIVPIVIPELWEFVLNWYNKSQGKYLISKDINNFRKREFYPALSKLGIIPPPIIEEKTDKNGKKHKLYKYDTTYTPHSTRHTFATLAKNAGIEAEYLQKLIGHAKYETTADIYIHEDINVLTQAMKRLTK